MIWLTDTLNALRLDRVSLIGVSYGGWLALTYAVALPQRVHKLVLLSAGGLLSLARQFTVRAMLMGLFPARLMVKWCMRWLGIRETPSAAGQEFVPTFLRLVHLGLRHFRMAPETMRVAPTVVSDDELRTLRVPALVLFGDHERICDPAAALARARRLIPHVGGDLIADCSHDMCFSQRRIVDARVLDFLNDRQRHIPARVVA